MKNKNNKNNKDIKFQCLDWRNFQVENDLDDESEDNNKLVYQIDIFGRTENNETIHLQVNNFKPYFYVEIPSNWNNNIINKFIENIKYKVYKKYKDGIIKYEVVSKCKFTDFTAYKKFHFIKLTFDNIICFKMFERVFNNPIEFRYISKIPKKYKLYESNIDPFLRCMHIQDIEGCGWVLLKKNKYIINSTKKSRCELDLETDWNNLMPIKSSHIMPFEIASFDIECTSIDGSFPNPKRPGDKIIQIGTTFNRYGEDHCYFKHIITLGSCKNIDGVTVEHYNTECEALIAWTKLIQRTDPDIMTGYNIFGFDWKYLYQRAVLLDIEKEFSNLGRLIDRRSEFIEKELSSSALGDNSLTYYDNIGRIPIDLMKVVQSGFKLGSYKLDSVAANFIRENIKKVKINDKETLWCDNKKIKRITTEIYTKSTYGLKEGQFITIYYNDGLSDNKYKDGEKFKIVKLESDKIKIIGKLDGEEMNTNKYISYWCQAKDDVPPNQIFKLQKGSSKDRSIIAKYCVMDCVLVNKLIAKLQVITNSISMANVCSVPISYLFLRGQGVKIYSLVAKECRLKNHLIPTLNRKNKFDDEKLKMIIKVLIKEIINKFNSNISELKFSNNKRDKVIKICRIILQSLLNTPSFENKIRKKPIFKNKNNNNNKYNKKELTENEIIKYSNSILESKKFSEEYNKNIIVDYKDQNYILINLTLKDVLYELDDAEDNYLYKETSESTKNKKSIDMDEALKELGVVDDNWYEGATVFVPDVGVHFDPVPVLDYASLYPRSMIQRNISHESLVKDKGYMDIPGYIYRQVIYKNSDGKDMVALFAQKKDGSKGILPEILDSLLDARAKTKKEMKLEKDPFKKAIKNGQQLALKLTANSLYGQTGAPTSPIHKKEIAASTTATGREMLILAKEFNESIFPYMINLIQNRKFKTYKKEMNNIFDGKVLDFNISDDYKKLLSNSPDLITKTCESRFKDKGNPYTNKNEFIKYFKDKIKEILGDYTSDPKVIYGDTDSVFLKFNLKNKEGIKQQDHNALKISIDLGILCGLFINKIMPYPHDLEYEKTFWPFIILTKKRYVGNLYEEDPNDYTQNSMGIVLKRRDNASIVKIVCGGVVRSILKDKNSQKAVEFTIKALDDILSEKYPMDKFIITKTLKNNYKDRTRIMHVVLADRIAKRDPGNKPQSNDRIPFAYIRTDHIKEKILQGERIEHPDYINKNNLELDYLFYITNQIMKPTVQFLSLLIKKPESIFNKFINIEENRRKGKQPITTYFKKGNDNNLYNYNVDFKEESYKKKKNKKNNKKKELSTYNNFPKLNNNITIDNLI